MYNADSDAYGHPDEDGYAKDANGNTYWYADQADEDTYADQDAENFDANGNTYDCYGHSNYGCYGDGDSDANRDLGDLYPHGYSSCGYG